MRIFSMQPQMLRTRHIWMLVQESFVVVVIKEVSLMYIRVFNPTSSSYCDTAIASLYRRFEWEKQRGYEQMVKKFIHSFGFSTLGNGWCSYHRFQKIFIILSVKELVPSMLWLGHLSWPNDIWRSGASFTLVLKSSVQHFIT